MSASVDWRAWPANRRSTSAGTTTPPCRRVCDNGPVRRWLIVSACLAGACSEPEPEGELAECGSLAEGDLIDLQNEELEAVLAAAEGMAAGVGSIGEELEADVLGLASTYGIPEEEVGAPLIEQLFEVVRADIDTYTLDGVFFAVQLGDCELDVGCGPTTIVAQYELAGGVDADEQAAFASRITQLESHGASILQGRDELEALMIGKVRGQTVYDPSLTGELTQAIEALIDALIEADTLVIPTDRVHCALPALNDAVDLVTAATSGSGGLRQIQYEFQLFFADP